MIFIFCFMICTAVFLDTMFIFVYTLFSILCVEERIIRCIPPNPRRVGYIDPIHVPLDGPLYIGSIYTNTPPRSLNYRRSGVQDWTTRKPTPPCSLNYRRSGVQDWTRRRLDKKKVQRANTPPQPQLALATLRLDWNSENVEEGRPLVKMSAN